MPAASAQGPVRAPLTPLSGDNATSAAPGAGTGLGFHPTITSAASVATSSRSPLRALGWVSTRAAIGPLAHATPNAANGVGDGGGVNTGTTYHFFPPTDDIVPPIYVPDPQDQFYPVDPLMHRLFRHYANRPRGRNIFLMSDGTFHDSRSRARRPT